MEKRIDETNRELTCDELDRVTGGLSPEMATTIFNVLAVVPVVGIFTQFGRTVGNVANIWTGYQQV